MRDRRAALAPILRAFVLCVALGATDRTLGRFPSAAAATTAPPASATARPPSSLATSVPPAAAPATAAAARVPPATAAAGATTARFVTPLEEITVALLTSRLGARPELPARVLPFLSDRLDLGHLATLATRRVLLPTTRWPSTPYAMARLA